MTEPHPQIVDLPADVDDLLELRDHPDEVTDDEAAAGRLLWLAIDDLDDESNGLGTDGLGTPQGLLGAGPRDIALTRARIVRDVLLRHGAPEVSIEIVEGRPTSGDPWNACKPVGAMSHHIASNPTPSNPTPGLAVVTFGRPDLGGPLCNGTAGVDLVYGIKCMGLANHPGVGGPMVVDGPCGAYRIPEDVGRPYLWGTEWEGGFDEAVWDREYTNARTGIRMSFREFMGRCNAGLVEAIWRINGHGRAPSPGDDLATYHSEHGRPWALGRKPDRLGYVADVSIGRNEIRRFKNPTTREDDDMSWDEIIRPEADVAWQRTAEGQLKTAVNQAAAAHVDAQAARKQAVANGKAIAALATALNALSALVADRTWTDEEKQGFLDAVRQAAEQGVTEVSVAEVAELLDVDVYVTPQEPTAAGPAGSDAGPIASQR